MKEMIPVRSVKHYVKEFIYDNKEKLNKPIERARIKRQMLDAFRREVFDQIACKLELRQDQMDRDKIATLEPVQNILKNEFRKWRRICMICNDAGLVNWLSLNDLKDILEEEDVPNGSVLAEENKKNENIA